MGLKPLAREMARIAVPQPLALERVWFSVPEPRVFEPAQVWPTAICAGAGRSVAIYGSGTYKAPGKRVGACARCLFESEVPFGPKTTVPHSAAESLTITPVASNKIVNSVPGKSFNLLK